ncbi:uncharacterized protein E0L32_010755 [Thyridium curvatum]|uniref:SYO1-like TPR repeats domain-containing protein n=1 Tax=Thyridium curvatum TaxID=1093900 RepID=A0A507AJ64_9PEZI|nr:uncharacterized protein E0L32_010755 [Thyridium curvatum]TPX07333.1 hypothetical protein E0L32_010755 [Thyridium curvatum]
MAKNRRNRVRPHRTDPIAKPVKPPTDPELAALREKSILPVLKDLKSSDPKSRTTAAEAIANIIHDEKCRKLLLREQVVHIVLSETLTDSSLESRAAGWDILRVLAEEEESDFCVHLFRSDILTALEHASKLVITTLTASDPPFDKATKAQQRFVWEIVRSLISLLAALSEARDEILAAVASNSALTQFLLSIVSNALTPPELVDEALQCLTTLTEDSRTVAQAVTDEYASPCYSKLLSFTQTGGSRGVLACGLLHNAFSTLEWFDMTPGRGGASDALLVPALARTLERTKLDEQSMSDEKLGLSSAEVVQLALEILAVIGTDLQAALEKGNKAEWAGIDDNKEPPAAKGDDEDHAMDDEAEDDEAPEDEDEDNEMTAEEMEADMDMVTGPDDLNEEDAGLDDLPTLRELIHKAVPQMIRLANLSSPASDALLAVQSAALSALNNLCWTVSCLDFSNGENAGVYAAWQPAARSIWSGAITPILSSDTADLSLATLVTSLAWAVSRSLGGSTPLQGDEHRRFISLYQASKGASSSNEGEAAEDPFQGLGVKCIGVLGQLARDPAPTALNREVGVFLVSLVGSLPQAAPADVVEALNQLFDIYGDENFACDKEVFWKDGFLKHLEESQPKLKAMAKGVDKRAFGELRSRVDEVMINLRRFIQYKKKNEPK